MLIVRGDDVKENMKDKVDKTIDNNTNRKFLMLIPLFSEIIKFNNDVQIHIQTTICYKNIVKIAS